MTRLRTIAPAEAPFTLTTGAAARDPEGFAALWERVRERLGPGGLEFPYATTPASRRLYDDLSVDSLPHPLALVQARLPGEAVALDLPVPDGDGDDSEAASLRALQASTQAISFTVFDHAIMIVEIETDIDPLLEVAEDQLPAALDAVHAAALNLTEAVITSIATRQLREVRAAIEAEDPRHRYVEAEPGTAAQPHPRWVSRALVITPDAPGAEAQLRHWLRDTTDDPAVVDRLLSGETDHVALWLNYAYLEGTPQRLESLWRAMRYAQYFYTALDQIDQRLMLVLAEAVQGRKRWELEQLGTTLRSLSQRAELVIMDLQMVRKFVNRHVRSELDAILDGWGFEDLIAEPVRAKVASCDRRLAELAAGSRERANTVTDVILLGIAVTSVLATALALTEFGRSVATDPDQAGFGVTRSGITEWFASQPADAILVGSVTLSLLLVVLFLTLRRPAP